MTLAATRELVDAAVAAGSAVPAFNVISLEHAEGVIAGAERAGVGILIQLSENAVRFHGAQIAPLAAACRELAVASDVRVGLHLDHFEDQLLIGAGLAVAERLGIGSVMVDASRHEYRDNVELTKFVAAQWHEHALWVEAELGEVGGKDGAHSPGVRTNPAEASRFVRDTGVDGLAVAVGSSHAMTERNALIDLDLIRELADAVDAPLVLHGSSGVPDDAITAAVAAGIRKVNVGTAITMAWTEGLREELRAQPDAIDPRRYSRVPRAAVADAVAHLCTVIAG